MLGMMRQLLLSSMWSNLPDPQVACPEPTTHRLMPKYCTSANQVRDIAGNMVSLSILLQDNLHIKIHYNSPAGLSYSAVSTSHMSFWLIDALVSSVPGKLCAAQIDLEPIFSNIRVYEKNVLTCRSPREKKHKYKLFLALLLSPFTFTEN